MPALRSWTPSSCRWDHLGRALQPLPAARKQPGDAKIQKDKKTERERFIYCDRKRNRQTVRINSWFVEISWAQKLAPLQIRKWLKDFDKNRHSHPHLWGAAQRESNQNVDLHRSSLPKRYKSPPVVQSLHQGWSDPLPKCFLFQQAPVSKCFYNSNQIKQANNSWPHDSGWWRAIHYVHTSRNIMMAPLSWPNHSQLPARSSNQPRKGWKSKDINGQWTWCEA